MTPNEWKDWIRGAREREIDMLERNIHLATANAMAQSKKGVKPMYRKLQEAREKLLKDDVQIRNDREKEIAQRRRLRDLQVKQAEEFFNFNK
ncbi:hypothetical protein CD122_01170 [Staphylococcus rostri]|uniref:Uncharacterized protein n=1 Tax=Staphylococcus rostri TaxID=522262 RepID=A0A2K3YWB9_9STAP|nr:hypothetical protein [Staphylococcus rostri]PNZ29909.1 hypothetical protein CD122_01170 [Staphylococcus rostri]